MHVESRKIDLEALVVAGQQQGYLTYSQINDRLPRGVTDIEAMEDVLRLLEISGVPVHETAPDADVLIARAEAERKPVTGAKPGAGGLALEEDPDASTDPVAHYFRDMGEIKRLEASDEITLARRIEQNRRQITQALALCPASVTALLEHIDATSDIKRVFIGEDDEDLAGRIRLVRQSHDETLMLIAEHGVTSPALDSLRHTLVSELGELRLTRRVQDELVHVVKRLIERVRDAENRITHNCVDRARIARRRFIDLFVGNELDDALVDRLVDDGDGNDELLRAVANEIRSAQKDIAGAVDIAGLTVGGLKTIGRSISTAHADAHRAREAMVEANLRLVVSIAKSFNNRGVAFSDLVQEGNIGLMEAVDHFDYRKRASFASQASWWIRRAINQSMGEQGHAIHVPAGMAEKIHRLNRLTRSMSHRLGRDPSPEELSRELKLPVDQVSSMMRLAREPMSLESPLGEDEGPGIGDYLADESASTQDRVSDMNALRDAARKLLDDLSPQEAAALRMHFGIGMDQTLSHEQIGEQFNLSREQARRLGTRALKKLRDPSRAAAFLAMLNAADD